MTSTLTVAAIQLTSTDDVQSNLSRATELIEQAVQSGANLVALPENFGFLGGEGQSVKHAQSIEDGPFLSPLRELAHKAEIAILAGSIPERAPQHDRVFNTSVLIGPKGQTLASYRKIHLFDVDLGANTKHAESAHVTPGAKVTTAEAFGWSLGLSICYDLRFPELFRQMAGVHAMFVPAAFTLHTGKDHWEVLLRARAIENQCFVIAPAQFGHHGGGRVSWGKSMIIDPWGTCLAIAPEREGVVLATLDADDLERTRRGLPCLSHRRLSA